MESPSRPKKPIELHRLPKPDGSPGGARPSSDRSASVGMLVMASQIGQGLPGETKFGEAPPQGLEYAKSIDVAVGEFRTIRIGGWESAYATVDGVSQSDAAICETVISGRTKIHVIGVAEGVMRLSISVQVVSSDPRSTQCEVQVRVTKEKTSGGKRLLAQIAAMDRAIRKAFPQCRVKIEPTPDRLVVSGICDTLDSRNRIIDMIRQISLVRVEDRIETFDSGYDLLGDPTQGLQSCFGVVPAVPSQRNSLVPR